LKDGLTDIKECIDKAMDYCLYDKSYRNQKYHSYNPINDALNSLNISYGNSEKSLRIGKILYESIDENAPKTSININMMFDFYKNKKTDFEIVCFLAFASLKSIIQKQVYKKITNEYLLNRMSGNSKNNNCINPLLKKYSNRYQLDKIKTELQLSWGLKYYAVKTRGFYASFTMPLNELAVIAERKNRTYKLKLLKEKIKEASRQAKEQVKNEKLPVIISNELNNNST